MSNDDKPSFYMIIQPRQTSIEIMKIPPNFTKNNTRNLPNYVTLRGLNEKIYPLRLMKDSSGFTFFEDGWESFFNDMGFEGGEFIVFTFDESISHFEVRIFDINGLERMPLIRSDSMQLSTELVVPAIPLKQIHPNCSKSIDYNYDEMLEKAGIKYPYILKRLTSYHVEKVFVLNFSKCSILEQYLPSEKETIVLLNVEGRSWDVSYIPKKNRSSLSGGWRVFAHDNGLKLDDLCAFEILSKHEIRVHVLGKLV